MRIRRFEKETFRDGACRLTWETACGEELLAYADHNLGTIMTAISAMAKQVSGVGGETRVLTSATDLDVFTIEPLTVAPYAYRVVMASGPYQCTMNLEDTVESILAGFGAAMKFFAVKRGLVVVEPDATRHVDRVAERGHA